MLFLLSPSRRFDSRSTYKIAASALRWCSRPGQRRARASARANVSQYATSRMGATGVIGPRCHGAGAGAAHCKASLGANPRNAPHVATTARSRMASPRGVEPLTPALGTSRTSPVSNGLCEARLGSENVTPAHAGDIPTKTRTEKSRNGYGSRIRFTASVAISTVAVLSVPDNFDQMRLRRVAATLAFGLSWVIV